jgi:hypothetical protein
MSGLIVGQCREHHRLPKAVGATIVHVANDQGDDADQQANPSACCRALLSSKLSWEKGKPAHGVDLGGLQAKPAMMASQVVAFSFEQIPP